MSIRTKVIGGLMAAGMITGVGMVGATPANAAAAFTPVCYSKTVVKKSGLFATKTYRNLVFETYYPAYPARTKVCHVKQTEYWDKVTDRDTYKVIYDDWITVRY